MHSMHIKICKLFSMVNNNYNDYNIIEMVTEEFTELLLV